MNTPQQQSHEGWAEAQQHSSLKTPRQAVDEIMFKIKPLLPEEAARRQKDHDDFEERQRLGRVNDIRARSGAWKRHMECHPKTEGAWGEKFTMLHSRLGSGFLSAIVGIGGNGKTQMGIELLKIVTAKEQSALFTTAASFFTAVKGTYRKDSDESEAEVLLRYRKPRLLIIDEFGKRSESEWEMTQLFELINNRYGDMTDTLLIDNRKREEFITTIGPSLASRMMETGGIIEASWESFRK